MIILDLYNYGKSSNRRLNTTSSYLQLCAKYTIKRLPFDVGIPWMGGKRTAEDQNEIFQQGNSKCDGVNDLSYHQQVDSVGQGLALDVVPWVDGKFAYDAYGRFGFVGAVMLDSWKELQEKGLIPEELHLHWGGYWRTKNPKKLGWDLAHYEIRTTPQIIRL